MPKTPLLALVRMGDSDDDFFIENCPAGPPKDWIAKYVYNISEVEHVEVYEMPAIMVTNWSNPNVSSED